MLEPVIEKIKELSRALLYWKKGEDDVSAGAGGDTYSGKESSPQEKFNFLLAEYLNLLKTLSTDTATSFLVPSQLLEYFHNHLWFTNATLAHSTLPKQAIHLYSPN